jgi:hypothetical protein
MAEDDAVAEGAGNFLTEKVGPLPIWAWMGAAGAIYLYLKKKNAAAAMTPTALTPSGTVGTTGGIGSSDMSGGGGGGSTGDTGSSGGTVAGQYATNDAWGRAAVNYLVGIGVDPTSANSAITQFLASQQLSTDQQGQVNLAIQALGAPPTLPTPGTAPPPVSSAPGTGTVYASNPPTGLAVTAKDWHSATLVWNKATNANSYSVTWSPPGANGSQYSVNGTDSTVDIQGLSPNTTYTFQVQAVPAKPTDPFASTTTTTPSQPASSQPPFTAPAPPTPTDPHAGQHLQPPQVATLVNGTSMRKWASEHPGNSLAVLEQLNPTLGPDVTAHPTEQIRTSDARWVSN